MKQDPTNDLDPGETIALEREILRRVCSGDARSTMDSVRELSSYLWRDTEHETVFEAIRALAARGAAGVSWREELPAQATRMGFPDLEWSTYFSAPCGTEPSLHELIARLFRAHPTGKG